MSRPRDNIRPAGKPTTQANKWSHTLEVTTRALSNRRDIAVKFQGNSLKESENELLLPKTYEGEPHKLARAYSDRFAALRRYHDSKLHQSLMLNGENGGAALDAAEKTRVECIASLDYPGVAKNLKPLDKQKIAQFDSPTTSGGGGQFVEAARWLLHETLSEKPLPKSLTARLSEWRPLLAPALDKCAKQLKDSMDNQQEFAKNFKMLMQTWKEEAGQNFVPPDMSEEQHDPNESSQKIENDEDAQDNKNKESMKDQPSEGEEGDEENAAMAQDEQARALREEIALAESQEAVDIWWQDQQINQEQLQYQAYTKRYDKVASALSLISKDETSELRERLDKDLNNYRQVVMQLSARLQRLLQSQQLRSWHLDQTEGWLDTTRLTRIVTQPLDPLAFKQESQLTFPDTIVSLLIDNSGSMRGRPIHLAAICADILAATFDKAGVKFEVLGFTTAEWKGGKSREQWLEAGKTPSKPGRLNDLLHIIYKAADVSYRRARPAISAMLCERILKENIDGEALIWAASRLKNRPEKRRILIMISDGAPVDDATLNSMGGTYLEQHLASSVKMLDGTAGLELFAIGIGHDLGRYFQRSVCIKDVESLGETLINELVELFVKQQQSAQ